MAEPSPSRPITLRSGRASATPTAAGQAVAETAAGAGMKGFALEHGQVVVHGTAAARRLFDDDAAGRAQRGDLLHQITIAQDDRAPGAARRGAMLGGARAAAGRASSSAATPSFKLRDDGGADGTPGRRAGVIGQLHQRGVLRNVRPVALDMIGEHRRAQRQNEICAVADARRSALRSAGRKPANSGWCSGKLLRADMGLTQTAA